MMMMFKRSILVGAATAALSVLTGCGEIAPGTQLVGQRCFADSDCAVDLVCSARRICVAPAPDNVNNNNVNNSANNANNGNNSANNANNGANNANNGANNANNGANNGNNANNVSPNNNANNVTPNNTNPNNVVTCEVGERYCVGERTYELCVGFDDGTGAELVRRDCPDGTRCEGDGRCVEECIDADGDGAFSNCEPFDCDDFNSNFSPLNEEICGDGLDNNCNRQVDENCEMECCPGGCGENAFCQDCACVMYDPFTCQFPNQPCQNFDTFSNGYYCLDLQGNGQGSCIGLCDLNSPDPAATCPAPGQDCTFQDPQNGVGLCFDPCNAGDSCGSPELGCFPYNDPALSQGGICTPTNPDNKLGDPCNAEQFFSCEAGAVCVDLGQSPIGGGSCTQACRPFQSPNTPTDCAQGNYCIGFGADVGVCLVDNGLKEGDNCTQIYTMCGEDNVVCIPTRTGAQRCRRLCRLDRGDVDCGQGEFCRDISQDDSGVGVCLPR